MSNTSVPLWLDTI